MARASYPSPPCDGVNGTAGTTTSGDRCDFDFFLCGFLNAVIPFVLITVLIFVVGGVYALTGTTDLKAVADRSRRRTSPVWLRVRGRDPEPADYSATLCVAP